MDTSREPRTALRSSLARLTALTIAMVLTPWMVGTQSLDICGCATIPDLKPFDSRDATTHPPGTIVSGTTLTLPVPEDGVLRFSSFFARNHIRFGRNAANTPVTILVSGDVTLDSATGCCLTVVLSGDPGRDGNSSIAGVGGLGGQGAFRGGDGANQTINGAVIAGAGFGPGGGAPGLPTACPGGAGQFFGSPELIPLNGGGGGGGGCSSSPTISCSGGGGGGGGGALLIAANGTITVKDYQIIADGGAAAGGGAGFCSHSGGGGAGGAIRLVANRLVAQNRGELYARGGGPAYTAGYGFGGEAGRIRLESVDSSAQVQLSAEPAAQRVVGPTPLTNPVAPTVTITAVAGNAVTAVPQGVFGNIDVVVPAPGLTSVDVATTGIPGGTTVQVTVKPRIGAQPASQTVPLSSCNGAGNCQATAVFNLPAGAYVIEARATFQTQ